jgi:hypothetical protein
MKTEFTKSLADRSFCSPDIDNWFAREPTPIFVSDINNNVRWERRNQWKATRLAASFGIIDSRDDEDTCIVLGHVIAPGYRSTRGKTYNLE